MGSGGAGLGAKGIEDGLAIAFNAKRGAETTQFVDTDSGAKLKAVTTAESLGNIENGNWHEAHVVWDADTHTLTYWIDGKLGGTLSGDLVNQYFGGSNQVHFGFTGATGSRGNLEQVHVTQLNANDGSVAYGALEACDCKPFIEMDPGHVSYLGKASSSMQGVTTLTTNAKSVVGGAFSTPVIDLHSDFSISFNFYAGTKDVASGGMAFVLQSDPLGGDALGRGGQALGAAGIRDGLGIALSMAKGADKTFFFDTDFGPVAGKVSPQTAIGNVENGAWHSAHVTWDADTHTLSYWIDGKLAGTLTGDLADQYFGGSDYVHFGFTGSTANSTNVQHVQVTAAGRRAALCRMRARPFPRRNRPFPRRRFAHSRGHIHRWAGQ